MTSPTPRVGGLGSNPVLEQVAGTPTRMTETEFDIDARMSRGVATTVLAQSLDEGKLLRLMREIEIRLAEPQLLEERSSLVADYALASALRAYIRAVQGYAS